MWGQDRDSSGCSAVSECQRVVLGLCIEGTDAETDDTSRTAPPHQIKDAESQQRISGRMVVMLHRARLEDAQALHALREELAQWQEGAGIVQWSPGETKPSDFLEQIFRQEWHLVRDSNHVAAAVRILDDDSGVWSDSGIAQAGYIHGLMVARSHAGQEVGRRLLSAAESIVSARGHRLARLDCVASNGTLRSYYRARGYAEVGAHKFPPERGWHPVTLFEKRLTE